MGIELSELTRRAFQDALAAVVPVGVAVGEPGVAALFEHYVALRRWAPRVSLLGPAVAAAVFELGYGESLEALPLLAGSAPGELVDVGSGNGFPGLVLAAALPEWRVTLVEPRERRWAFLSTVVAKAGLSCRCLDARVDARLPEGLPWRIDCVTVRALRLGRRQMAALAERLSPGGRILFWLGAGGPTLVPGLAVAERRRLAGAESRQIVVVERSETK